MPAEHWFNRGEQPLCIRSVHEKHCFTPADLIPVEHAGVAAFDGFCQFIGELDHAVEVLAFEIEQHRVLLDLRRLGHRLGFEESTEHCHSSSPVPLSGNYVVTAPRLALPTLAAYFANTPRLYRASGARKPFNRAAISSLLASNVSFRPGISNVIRSP